jgi:predicted Fe-Mo cluster-binding NifX family protein
LAPTRVAIPLFGSEVAPRFCFARRMLLVELADGAVASRQEHDVANCGWQARLRLLSTERVSLLLCGGFNRRYLSLAEALGIFVSWGHVGPVEPLLEQLCRGTLPQPAISCGRGPGRRHKRGQRPGNGRPD